MKLKIALRMLAISIVLVMVGSGIVTGAGSVNNASNVSLSSATIYVPDDYAKIQWAVDNASAGDTIIVRDGTYTENVDVNKSLTIQSENGSALTIIQAKNSNDHVFEVTADYVNISAFTVKGATGYLLPLAGVYLTDADHCVISNNEFSNNNLCMLLFYSSDNTLTNNNASDKGGGIDLWHSSNNTISNNTASNNTIGILLYCSINNTLKNNTMSENRNNFGISGEELSHYIHNIDTSNLVDGSPIYYWVNRQDNQIPSDAGYVGIVNSTNITVKDLTLTNNGEGVLLAHSKNSRIENVNASNNSGDGIHLWHSSNNTITNNIANSNYRGGINLCHSSNNNIANNTANSNDLSGIYLCNSSNNNITNNAANSDGDGISLYHSSNNIIKNSSLENCGILIGGDIQHFNTHEIENNTVNGKPIYYYKNEYGRTVPENAGEVILANCFDITVKNIDASHGSIGIQLAFTANSFITDNIVNSNSNYGIFIYCSSNNSIVNNIANTNSQDGIRLYNSLNNSMANNIANSNNRGICLRNSSNNSIVNNTANSNNHEGIQLSDSSNNSIVNNTANSNNYDGIYLSNSSNNCVKNNTANSNSHEGIWLFYSSNNNIANNNANSNNWCGINLMRSSNNKIYLNNFINNRENVWSPGSTNIWNSTSPISYTYNGSTYTNYLGNYWDDYKEKYPGAEEIEGTGIWDMPYGIDSDQDNHPLKELWENYFAPVENIFDTGSPANPYPSIMGNHTGTIKPNHTVIATKLYTYPCVGTGGHTEYARIWNSTWNATATWEGYAGDWHNISFDKTVVLLANKTYNYTIHTGSYPQIIHESPFNATGGTITCDKFIDANGRIYYGWIPAIKLWT
jgi:parallel beta-helix repeat protein